MENVLMNKAMTPDVTDTVRLPSDFSKSIKPLRFFEGELIEIKRLSGYMVYEIRADHEGEPRKHLLKKKTGEVAKTGQRIKISDNFRRINNYMNNQF
jgi:L-lysine 2,3-aminomutase